MQDLLEFYQQFASQNQDATGLQLDIARASYRIGQIHNRLGQFQKAQMACQLTQRLIHEQHSTGQDSIWHFENELEYAWATQMLGQHREARDIYSELLLSLEESSDHPAEDDERHFLLAQVHLRLGSMPLGKGRESRNGPDNNPANQSRTALQLSQAWLSRSPDHQGFRLLVFQLLSILGGVENSTSPLQRVWKDLK